MSATRVGRAARFSRALAEREPETSPFARTPTHGPHHQPIGKNAKSWDNPPFRPSAVGWKQLLESAGVVVPEVEGFVFANQQAAGDRAGLNRLSKIGSWSRKTSGTKRFQIFHSSAPKRTLSVSLLNNCSVAIQSRKGKKAQCDKLLLPFGAPARQVCNLLHITTRDLFWIHFGKPKAFVKTLSRRKSLSPEEEAFKPLLNFVWRHRFELQGLLGLNSCKKT